MSPEIQQILNSIQYGIELAAKNFGELEIALREQNSRDELDPPDEEDPVNVDDTWPHIIQAPYTSFYYALDELPENWGHDRTFSDVILGYIDDTRDKGYLHRISLNNAIIENAVVTSSRYAMFSSAGLQDVLFDTMVFHGQLDEAAVRIYNGTRVVFRNCIFRTLEPNNKHTLRLYSSNDILFENCTFERGRVKIGGPDSGQDGAGEHWTRHVRFKNCTFNVEGNVRALELWNCEDVWVEGCEFTGVFAPWHPNNNHKVLAFDDNTWNGSEWSP